MKKFQIIIINIMLIILIYLLLEIASVLICLHRYPNGINYFVSPYFKMGLNVKLFNPKTYDEYYRNPIIVNNDKKPIVIFGCSFAFGSGYGSDIVGEIISKLTDRSVYNRAFGGMGPQMMLYQLRSGKIKEITNDVSYIIYIFAADPEVRTLKFRNWPFLGYMGIKYKLMKDGSLKLKTPNLYMTYSNIYRMIEDSFPMFLSRKYIGDLYYQIVKESYMEVKKQFPNCKFIILNYRQDEMAHQKDIEALGIKIINKSDLTEENLNSLKYQLSKDDSHPNKSAWNLILPVFVKKANIY